MRERAADFLSDLGVIPTSHRELFLSLERAKIRLDGHRVVYWTSEGASGAIEIAHAIPYCNLSFLLLGPGCSVSSDAMELLAAAGVVVGFTGAGDTPLHAGVEPVAFACGQSEYRPTAYMQAWTGWWFDDAAREQKGRDLLVWRAKFIEEVWASKVMRDALKDLGVSPLDAAAFFETGSATPKSGGIFSQTGQRITAEQYAAAQFTGNSVTALLGQEGVHVKRLYQFLKRHTGIAFDGRDPQARDDVNGLLTLGNYIAYGLSATALHGLGVSYAFAILHGKTRRGALVFDIADPIKDAVIAPIAFACAKAGKEADACRRKIKEVLEDLKALSAVMACIKTLAGETSPIA